MWFLFAFMVLYVIFDTVRGETEVDTEGIDEGRDFGTWLIPILAVAAFGLCVMIASQTNGPQTMTSAATRWPVWVWNEGSFPGMTASQSSE